MKVAAIVLAAGGSTRLGQPKQLLDFRGQSLVRRMAEAVVGAGCEPVAVVVGQDREAIAAALRGLTVQLVPNDNWKDGIGSSIRVGVKALAACEALVIAACDQPYVDAELIRLIIRTQEETQQLIVASAYAGTCGVPALFLRHYRANLLALPNEHGAKAIIARHSAEVATVDFPQGAIDIDTLADYRALQVSP
ncbi:MAG TPA: nucleotidyltransferase family protein [Chthoniobacterales bacterium]